MDDFTLRLVIMVIAGVALFVLARSFSSNDGSVHAASLPPQFAPVELPQKNPSPAAGSEIAFPFDIRELEAKYGPDVRRPAIRNYYFRNIDLLRGPEDPAKFCDEFFLDCEDPATGYVSTSSYVVATPAGLQSALEAESSKTLWLQSALLVPRYDLALIMRAVCEQLMEPTEESTLKVPAEEETE